MADTVPMVGEIMKMWRYGGDSIRPMLTIFKHKAMEMADMGETVHRRYHYIPRTSDVIVVGAPKTGTTWLQQILHQIRTKGDMNFKDIYDVCWWLPYPFMPVDGFDFGVDQPAEPRILKSHETYETIPKATGVRYIVITREPMDAAWSLMKFVGGFLGTNADLIPADLMLFTCRNLLSRKAGGPEKLIESWWPHRHEPNVLWIHYEDLKKDLPYCVEILAQFIGVRLTQAEIETVVEHSSFDFMVQHKDKFSGENEIMKAVLGVDGWKPKIGMVRPGGGKSGQGKHNLPDPVRNMTTEQWLKHVKEPLGFDNYQTLLNETSILKQDNIFDSIESV